MHSEESVFLAKFSGHIGEIRAGRPEAPYLTGRLESSIAIRLNVMLKSHGIPPGVVMHDYFVDINWGDSKHLYRCYMIKKMPVGSLNVLKEEPTIAKDHVFTKSSKQCLDDLTRLVLVSAAQKMGKFV